MLIWVLYSVYVYIVDKLPKLKSYHFDVII